MTVTVLGDIKNLNHDVNPPKYHDRRYYHVREHVASSSLAALSRFEPKIMTSLEYSPSDSHLLKYLFVSCSQISQ